MYVLYWHPFSSSLAPMAVLEETGAAYEAVRVDIETGENFSPAYMKIHPYGRVPALKLPGGGAVFESAGLVMFLADQHPGAGLAPAPHAPERAAYYQWLLFMADSLYPSYNRFYRCERYAASAQAQAEVRDSAVQTRAEQWQVIEQTLLDQAWLLGDTFTAADIYLMMLTTWDEDPDGLARRCPNVMRVAGAAAERPTTARALARHAPNDGGP